MMYGIDRDERADVEGLETGMIAKLRTVLTRMGDEGGRDKATRV